MYTTSFPGKKFLHRPALHPHGNRRHRRLYSDRPGHRRATRVALGAVQPMSRSSSIVSFPRPHGAVKCRVQRSEASVSCGSLLPHATIAAEIIGRLYSQLRTLSVSRRRRHSPRTRMPPSINSARSLLVSTQGAAELPRGRVGLTSLARSLPPCSSDDGAPPRSRRHGHGSHGAKELVEPAMHGSDIYHTRLNFVL